MNLRAVLAGALERLRDLLSFRSTITGDPGRYDLIAIGKAAAPMVDGLLHDWGPELVTGLVVLPDGAAEPLADRRIQVMRASHPLPDERSVAAGEAALALAAGGEGAALYVLISGGASSLVAAPVAGVTLESFRDVTRALLLSGADVRAINVVRRHLSKAHGGGIARAAWPRPVLSRIVSDVIDGEPPDVGSGPTSPDPSTIEDARAVLARYAPSFRDLALSETLKPGDQAVPARPPRIDLAPRTLAEAAARRLEDAGFAVRVLPSSTAGVDVLVEEYDTIARALHPGEGVVRAAEPALRVTVSPAGSGGRCTHLAALVARQVPAGVQFMAAASDGVDGSSETGGAIVDASSFPGRLQELDAAIAAFDTGTLHRVCGTALPCAPTGLNFADLHVLVRERR